MKCDHPDGCEAEANIGVVFSGVGLNGCEDHRDWIDGVWTDIAGSSLDEVSHMLAEFASEHPAPLPEMVALPKTGGLPHPIDEAPI